jgi:Protein of unknown function (DUF3455)
MAKPSLKRFSLQAFAAAAVIAASPSSAGADSPAVTAAPNEALVVVVNAVGAQVYECKPDARGQFTWQFREPIATLLIDGKTVGRHFAGPNWELTDGSAVTGKVIARAPGATAKDIPLLKLEVTSRREGGRLASVTRIQRLNTVGGTLEGACPSAGALVSVPYAADYTFLRGAD